MQPIKAAAAEFLAGKRIAVTGVSRTGKDHGSNVVYKRMRERGYDVFAVNPNADEVGAEQGVEEDDEPDHADGERRPHLGDDEPRASFAAPRGHGGSSGCHDVPPFVTRLPPSPARDNRTVPCGGGRKYGSGATRA